MAEKGRKPAGLIMKTLDRCRSARRSKTAPAPAPEGCFTVCVGAGRQRFVVRTECVNHPLFRALLEEAEEAFGYAAAGPLALPCDADAFVRVLEQIEEEEDDAAGHAAAVARCGLVRGHSAYRLLVPARTASPRRPVLANSRLGAQVTTTVLDLTLLHVREMSRLY